MKQSGNTVIATATVPANGTSVFSNENTIATPFTVTNTRSSGTGSLSKAITNADGTPGSTIAFNIPTNDPGYNPSAHTFTIALSSVLPAITEPMTINGTTESTFLSGQPGFIAINGTGISGSANGLNLSSGPGGSDIFGLEIVDFSGRQSSFRRRTIQSVRSRRCREHPRLKYRGGGSISGVWATGNVVVGNFIGTDPSGDNLANGIGVFVGGGSNLIGGVVSGSANVIGFNGSAGVSIRASHVVEGNFIGTSSSNTTLNLGNTLGVVITGASAANNTIGGSSAAASNAIAFNNSDATHGAVTVNTGTGNSIRENLIYDNQGGVPR